MNKPEEVDNLFATKQKIDEDKNAETKIKNKQETNDQHGCMQQSHKIMESRKKH